jgi:nucleolar protein 56
MAGVNVLITKGQLRKPKPDRMLMQAVGVVDELDRVINTLSERMREWYGLYFPEAEKLIQSHEQLARAIGEEGKRERIRDKKVARYAGMSAGMPFSEEDLSAVQEYAREVSGLFRTREHVAEYVRTGSRKAIPNLSAVAGPLIACRLLAHAGGLEKLAKMSAGTIQLLGAERALFRHLRGHGRAPKFGVIFAHPMVQQAGKNERGKLARIIASKLAMAARADFYTGKDISEKLVSDLKSKAKSSAAAGRQKRAGSGRGKKKRAGRA